jgi:hypothetical protein
VCQAIVKVEETVIVIVVFVVFVHGETTAVVMPHGKR